MVLVVARLAMVLLPLVTLPPRLKVMGLLVCATVGVAESVTVPVPIAVTVVGVLGYAGMPLELLVATIPTNIPVVLLTVTILLLVVQVAIVATAVGSVYVLLTKLLAVFVFGPTDSRLPV